MNKHNLRASLDWLANLPLTDFVTGIYAPEATPQDILWLDSLCRSLRNNGIIVTGIATCQDKQLTGIIKEADYHIVVNKEELSQLGRINVFLTTFPEYGIRFPTFSRILGFLGAASNANSLLAKPDLPDFAYLPACLDGWLFPEKLSAVRKAAIGALWNGFVCAQHSSRPNRPFYIIPLPERGAKENKGENAHCPMNSVCCASDSVNITSNTDVAWMANVVREVFQDTPKTEWIVVTRTEKAIKDNTLLRHWLVTKGGIDPAIPALLACYHDPDSPLLTALALHMGILHNPEECLPGTLMNKLAHKLSSQCAQLCYNSIPPEQIRSLYAQALLEYMKQGDAQSVNLAESLLEEFDQLKISFHKATTPEAGKSTQSAILDLVDLNSVLNKISPETFVVGLYINLRQGYQDDWMSELALSLNNKGFYPIGILTPDSVNGQRLKNVKHLAVVPYEAIHDLKRINVFIISDADWATQFPQTSKVLGCAHALWNKEENSSFDDTVFYEAVLDGWLFPNVISNGHRKSVSAALNGLIDNRFTPRKGRYYYVIPMGYPPMALCWKQMQKINCQPDAIVYAPIRTGAGSSTITKDRIKKEGLKVINFLLENFPDYNVIFRPYYDDMKEPAVKEIVDVFKNHPKFSCDLLAEKAGSFARAAVLITDQSTIAPFFAFLTKRPAIYFKPWINDHKLQHWNGGLQAHTFEQLYEAVSTALDKSAGESNRITENSRKCLMPFHNTFDDIAELLLDFCAGKPRPNWITVDRMTRETGKTDTQIVAQIDMEKSASNNIATTAAIFREPSALITAVALHCGMKHYPDKKLWWGIFYVAASILGRKVPFCLYSALAPDIVRDLYASALKEKTDTNDHGRAAMIKKLITDFEKLLEARGANGV